MPKTVNYTANDVKVLGEVEHIRLNPGMYIGSTDTPTHLLEEVLDNSLDEALTGYAKIIAVVIDTKENKFSVLDSGRGIPIDDNTPITISTKLFSGAKFHDRKTAYDISCLVGDTKIMLLDGRHITIKEMAENPDTEYWGLSSTTDGKWKATRLLSPQITGYTKELIKVTIDNGETEVCTPDHLWLLRDGTYKKAEDLNKNDSLMPCYYSIKNGYTLVRINNTYDYIRNINFKRRKRVPLHKIVFETIHGKIPKGSYIHHKDLCRNNNYPENLQLFTSSKEHLALHVQINKKNGTVYSDSLVRYNKSERGRQKSRENAQKYGIKALQKYNQTERHKRDKSRLMKKLNVQNSHEYLKRKILKFRNTLLKNNFDITKSNWDNYRPYGVPKFDNVMIKYFNIAELKTYNINLDYYCNKFEKTNGATIVKTKAFLVLKRLQHKQL
ncbi:MAG: HNH endonuclease, partial [Promethearchaeota archaeon]